MNLDLTNPSVVAHALRGIRAKLNLTQEQLAKELGVSFATVNRWEGKTSSPQETQRKTIASLIERIGIDLDMSDEGTIETTNQLTRQRTNISTKNMEQMLWNAACSIRGEKDASKFKDFLLPLLFLKRLSDVFDDEIDRLAEDFGDRGIALENAELDHSLLRFYLPPEARWGIISERETLDWSKNETGYSEPPTDVGDHLTKAVRAVVRHNPSLSGVIDIVDFAAERNGERDINPSKLRGIVEIFSNPRYRLGLNDVQPDFLGRSYEYLLRKFSEGSGQSAGEYFTPPEVGFLMAHIINAKPGEECHDYACGSAGLLIKLQLVARELNPTSNVPLKMYGQELQAENFAIAKMNAIIHDMDVDVARGDTMINPKFKTTDSKIRTYDIVVANPMWNQPFDSSIYKNDPFDRFSKQGGITSNKGDWAWLQHTMACLNKNGRAAVVLDTGAMTRGSGAKNEDKEKNIRKWFVDNDLIDGVILMPDNLFYNTSAAGVIIVLSKNKSTERKNKILFLNATKRVKKGRPKNYIPEDDIRPLAEAFIKGKPIEGEITVISRKKIEETGYNLSPNQWVESTETEQFESIPEIITDLTKLNNENHDIDLKLTKLMHKLFTSGLNEETQKETEIGLIPKSWKLIKIGELFEIKQGVSLKRNLSSNTDGIPFLRTSNVYWGQINLDKINRMHIDSDRVRDLILRKGDLLVCEGGEIGRAAVWNEKLEGCVYQNHIHRLRPLQPETVDPYFIVAWLTEGFLHRNVYEGAGNKTTIPNLSRARLAELSVPIPTFEKQREIASVIDVINNKINLHRRKRDVLDRLFKSLLHKLMTGEILISDLDLSAIESKSPEVAV